MSQKWYQKASVQVALVTVFGAIVSTLIIIAQQRSELTQENKSLKKDLESTYSVLDDIKRERDKFEVQLAPFLATAKARFPDAPADKRLELLLGRIEQAVSEVHEAARRIGSDRVLPDYVVNKVTSQLMEQRKMVVSITAVLGDTNSFALAKQLESIFRQAGWQISSGGIVRTLFNTPQKGCKFIFPQDQAPSLALVEPFLEILGAIGQEKKLYTDPKMRRDKLNIIIGSK